MPAVFPFRALQYSSGTGDVSSLAAPPYDVLDAPRKASLLARDQHNIVAVDLPHTPAKSLGPASSYEAAARTLESWIASGVLVRRDRPAMFACRQTFTFDGRTFERCGMACTLGVVPMGPRPGGGILPHEQTFSGPKEDRLALMKATRTQLSPIFGMHQDTGGKASAIVRAIMASRAADLHADIAEADGQIVRHEVWTVVDEATISAYSAALAGEDVFIADGHHRYNTALTYLASLGDPPQDHPARRGMFVLVSMADPGLVIGPTHRVLGGMRGYSPEAFIEASAGLLQIDPVVNDPALIEAEMAKALDRGDEHVFGIIDFATGLCWTASTVASDPLLDRFESRSAVWRGLDVAIVQHLIVEEICVPLLNGGEDVRWAFPHSVAEAVAIGRGAETGSGGGAGFAQLGIIVRPVPLGSVREVCRSGELMPQKATFFYPKMATGLFINPLA